MLGNIMLQHLLLQTSRFCYTLDESPSRVFVIQLCLIQILYVIFSEILAVLQLIFPINRKSRNVYLSS